MKAYEFLDQTTQRATYLFRLFGYARSGQHAISHWLMKQAPQTSLWINNLHGYKKTSDFQHYWYGKVCLEDIYLLGIGFEGDLRRLSYHFQEVPLILVVRDIYNQTASVAKHPDLKLGVEFFEGWRRNALQALGEINILNSPCIVVKYNDWVSSEEYKREIFEEIKLCLGFPYLYKEGRDREIINIGGGSSFDGTKEDAKKMKVLERYKDPSVQSAISQIPEELKMLSARLFPAGQLNTPALTAANHNE
jgi:hypothetical protein